MGERSEPVMELAYDNMHEMYEIWDGYILIAKFRRKRDAERFIDAQAETITFD